MILALVIFAVTYLLMLALPKERPWVALCSAAVFMALGQLGVYDFSLSAALGAVDYNVLLMMSGTMGIVSLFIRSRMPARLAEQLIVRVPNAQWAVCVLALFAGVISAFVDNVATVLMVAPVGLAIARKLKISPVPVIIAIAVSSNLQGAATLVGDTTSILLGGFAEMNFFDFFWMHGRPGIFWGVELGALTSLLVLLWLFRREKQSITARVETQVEDDVPTALMLLTVGLLIAASFLPQPAGGLPLALYGLRSGLICAGVCLFGILRACLRLALFRGIFRYITAGCDSRAVLIIPVICSFAHAHVFSHTQPAQPVFMHCACLYSLSSHICVTDALSAPMPRHAALRSMRATLNCFYYSRFCSAFQDRNRVFSDYVGDIA